MDGMSKEAVIPETKEDLWTGLSAGRVLRHELLNKITPVLLLTDSVEDTSTRLMMQASCLDMVAALEEVIKQYELDMFPSSVAC
jgi:hypothetical protein